MKDVMLDEEFSIVTKVVDYFNNPICISMCTVNCQYSLYALY